MAGASAETIQAKVIKETNRVMVEHFGASAPLLAYMTFNAVNSLTGNGIRPCITSNRKLLEYMGLEETPAIVRGMTRAVQALHDMDLVEIYSRPAGRGKGNHRILALKTPEERGILEEPDIKAGLDEMRWPEVKAQLFTRDGQFNPEWRQNIYQLRTDRTQICPDSTVRANETAERCKDEPVRASSNARTCLSEQPLNARTQQPCPEEGITKKEKTEEKPPSGGVTSFSPFLKGLWSQYVMNPDITKKIEYKILDILQEFPGEDEAVIHQAITDAFTQHLCGKPIGINPQAMLKTMNIILWGRGKAARERGEYGCKAYEWDAYTPVASIRDAIICGYACEYQNENAARNDGFYRAEKKTELAGEIHSKILEAIRKVQDTSKIEKTIKERLEDLWIKVDAMDTTHEVKVNIFLKTCKTPHYNLPPILPWNYQEPDMAVNAS